MVNKHKFDFPCDLPCAVSRQDHPPARPGALADLVHEEAHPVVPNPR